LLASARADEAATKAAAKTSTQRGNSDNLESQLRIMATLLQL
jgi:hypothetical protein